MTRYTEAEQENRNFSIEEFLNFANPSKPIPLIFHPSRANDSLGITDDKTWFDIVSHTIDTVENLGYFAFPLGIERMADFVDHDGNVIERRTEYDKFIQKASRFQYKKIKEIFQIEDIALYVPGCFCCGADPTILRDYHNGKLGFVAPSEHLLGYGLDKEKFIRKGWVGEGETRALPQIHPNHWNDTKGKLAVKDISQIKEEVRKYFAPAEEGNFYRILLDLD